MTMLQHALTACTDESVLVYILHVSEQNQKLFNDRMSYALKSNRSKPT